MLQRLVWQGWIPKTPHKIKQFHLKVHFLKFKSAIIKMEKAYLPLILSKMHTLIKSVVTAEKNTTIGVAIFDKNCTASMRTSNIWTPTYDEGYL